MKINSELLLNYGAPDEFLSFFDNNYPDGEEAGKIILNNDVPISIIHFIRKFINLTPAQSKQYLDRCNIQDSNFVYNSENIFNSNNIINSKNIKISQWIQDSDNVTNSSNIYSSTDIKNGFEIWKSKMVRDSSKIILSENISDSDEVLYSHNINWSSIINYSSDIISSKAIYHSEEIENSFFCGFCAKVTNSLFCTNIENKNYYLFNAPVDPMKFEQLREELFARLINETFNFICVDSSEYYADKRYTTSVRFDTMFSNLSPDFWGWVGTLPNYSEEVFLRLFFKS